MAFHSTMAITFLNKHDRHPFFYRTVRILFCREWKANQALSQPSRDPRWDDCSMHLYGSLSLSLWAWITADLVCWTFLCKINKTETEIETWLGYAPLSFLSVGGSLFAKCDQLLEGAKQLDHPPNRYRLNSMMSAQLASMGTEYVTGVEENVFLLEWVKICKWATPEDNSVFLTDYEWLLWNYVLFGTVIFAHRMKNFHSTTNKAINVNALKTFKQATNIDHDWQFSYTVVAGKISSKTSSLRTF